MWATLVNCTGFAEISGLSALKIIPRAGGSKLIEEKQKNKKQKQKQILIDTNFYFIKKKKLVEWKVQKI